MTRVRFAPSPTGYLHIGGARTALYNWLWARQHGGQLVLRLEDTDQARSTPESRAAILDALRWLELDWDEGPGVGGPHGPYQQSDRLALYREHADRMVDAGLAYRCYATKQELDQARAAHEASGAKDAFRYPGWWRERTDWPADQPYVVRFKAPEAGTTAWDDLVKGRIEVLHETLQDFVLLRSDGMPLYNFGCVIDDWLMRIDLVARGDDHMINTTPQILLYQALGAPVPSFAHTPMILAPNGEKLSKRHAAVSVTEYRDMGYLPDAVLNYLARVGWSHGDQEIFSRQELVELFGWSTVSRKAGRYDAKKFEHVQAQHLRQQSPAKLAADVQPFLRARQLAAGAHDPRLAQAIESVLPRVATLVELADAVDYFFREPLQFDEAAEAKFLVADKAPLLTELSAVLAKAEPFDAATLEQRVKAWLEERALKMKDVAQPARVALTGRTKSPGLFEVMDILGRQQVLARLSYGAAVAAARG